MPRNVRREAATLILKDMELGRSKWQGIMQSRLELVKQLVEQYPTSTLEKVLRGDAQSKGGSLTCVWSRSCRRVLPQGIELNTHVILGGETAAQVSRRGPHNENRWGMTRSGRWFTVLAIFGEDDSDSRPPLARLEVHERSLQEMVVIYGPKEIAELLGDFIHSCRHRHCGLFKAIEILDAQESLLREMRP